MEWDRKASLVDEQLHQSRALLGHPVMYGWLMILPTDGTEVVVGITEGYPRMYLVCKIMSTP